MSDDYDSVKLELIREWGPALGASRKLAAGKPQVGGNNAGGRLQTDCERADPFAGRVQASASESGG